MNPAIWRHARELIGAALDLPESARSEFLLKHCDEPELRAEIQALLKRATDSGLDVLPLNYPGFDLPSSTVTAQTSKGIITTLPSRFHILAKLGSGTFGDVYRVFDDRTHAQVALKVLRNTKALALYQFKQEFRSLVALRHRNIARLYELIDDNGTWMLTMELIDGVPFNKSVTRASNTMQVRTALSQLLTGVSALHSEGFLHRDLKPSNVLVTPQGRVVLVDFGLVRQLYPLDRQDTLSIAGTPAYMAPEQISRGALTEAADWYAVGVMLFETLTGRLPFDGPVFDLLSRKEWDEPILPPTIDSSIAPDLSEICLGLLRREPTERLSGEQARIRLALTDVASQSDGPPESRVATFIGRETELEAVDTSFEATLAGVPQIVQVTGDAGIGKTAFIAKCIERVRTTSPNVVVFSGRCHPTESVSHPAPDPVPCCGVFGVVAVCGPVSVPAGGQAPR